MTIIDRKSKYIFIANKKTGSTSIHRFLAKKYEKNNELSSNRSHALISMKTIFDRPIGKHDTYLQIKQFINSHKKYGNINDYFIFGFIREPCDRLLSSYKYEGQKIGFEQYVKNNMTKHFHPVPVVFHNRKRLPPNVHIYKLEELDKSMIEICRRLKLTYKPLSVCNKTSKKRKPNVTNNMKNIIYKKYPIDAKHYL